jgi:hypothetical protein
MKRWSYSLFWLCIAAVSTFGQAKPDAPNSEATLAYDVKLREFTCWREGRLTEQAQRSPYDNAASRECNSRQYWHPVNGNLYFVRGQAVSVLLVNAVAADLFGLEVTANDLAEPTIPISGSISELPKLLSIPPAPTLIAGVGAAFSAGSATDPNDIYRLLTTSDEKDFKSWLQTKLIDPSEAKELTDFLSIRLEDALGQLSNMTVIKTEVRSITPAVSGIAVPTTLGQLIDSVNQLARLLGTEAALRNRLLATGIAANGKVVSDALAALHSPAVQRVLGINQMHLEELKDDFALEFPPDSRFARIDAVEIQNDAYIVAQQPMGDFLRKVNAAAGNRTSPDGLTRLKKNLTILAENWSDLEASAQRRTVIETRKTTLEDPAGVAAGLVELQVELNALADLTIQKAAMLNESAQVLPLDEKYQVLPVGEWFSSKQISITLKQGQRLRFFDIGGVSDSARSSVTGGDQPAAKTVQTAGVDLTTVRTFQFRVYNLYRFTLGLGFVYSSAEDKRFQVVKQTTGSGDAAVTQVFFDETRSRDYNLLATVDLIVFPSSRHAFPCRPRYAGEKCSKFYHDIGPMIGFSITSPNRDFLLGGAWFPRQSPIGFKMGWHIALRDYPPKGVGINEPFTDPLTVLQQTRRNGLFLGMTFTTDFFGKVFAPIFKP